MNKRLLDYKGLVPEPPKTEPVEGVEGDEIKGRQKSHEAQERSYYYDDAHGYEEYDPENEGEVEEADKVDGLP